MPVGEISTSLLVKIDALILQDNPEEEEEEEENNEESTSSLAPSFSVTLADQQKEKDVDRQECVVQSEK